MNVNEKIKRLNKKLKTLSFVHTSIDLDMKKISKKSKEYKSMQIRNINLLIEMLKTQVATHSLALAEMRLIKKEMSA